MSYIYIHYPKYVCIYICIKCICVSPHFPHHHHSSLLGGINMIGMMTEIVAVGSTVRFSIPNESPDIPRLPYDAVSALART